MRRPERPRHARQLELFRPIQSGARSTRGESARAMPQHAARSNIHSGIARRRSATCAVSEHRKTRAFPLTSTS